MWNPRKPVAVAGFFLVLFFFGAMPATFGASSDAPKPEEDSAEIIRAQAVEYIALNRSLTLTAKQEAVKKAALSSFPAPCCKNFSMATCCCPCNLAKAVWGLSKKLVVHEGYDATQVKEAVQKWLRAANPDGFNGNACNEPWGCVKPFESNGCGGMRENAL